MATFPRTTVGGESVSRMIVGTNWFLGWSHATDAKDRLIRDLVMERTRIAEILAVFFAAGVDTVMGPFPHPPLLDAVRDAEQRSGVKAVIVSTPSFTVGPHIPEAIIYADDTSLDVETYISIFNCAGFLMQIEVDWTAQIIAQARRPVMTIKPLAAGRVRPFQGLTFAWNAIRDVDMVTVGTMSAREAQECIELSLDILERRGPGTCPYRKVHPPGAPCRRVLDPSRSGSSGPVELRLTALTA